MRCSPAQRASRGDISSPTWSAQPRVTLHKREPRHEIKVTFEEELRATRRGWACRTCVESTHFVTSAVPHSVSQMGRLYFSMDALEHEFQGFDGIWIGKIGVAVQADEVHPELALACLVHESLEAMGNWRGRGLPAAARSSMSRGQRSAQSFNTVMFDWPLHVGLVETQDVVCPTVPDTAARFFRFTSPPHQNMGTNSRSSTDVFLGNGVQL